ncbi:MAG TPA: YceI family protein [Bacteroidia bacterium]|jgi:polyisoprenoid-binding protein YceI|nr:YceI family protein [Bacteroidia bacterium]
METVQEMDAIQVSPPVQTSELKERKSTWNLDKEHAQLSFRLKHLLISEIEGAFRNFDIRFSVNANDFSDASVEAAIHTPSIYTGNPERDKHLQIPAFFNVDRFPYIHFKSTSFVKTAERHYCLTGILSMLGVKHLIDLDVVHNGNARDPETGSALAGFTVRGRIKRSDFQLASAVPTSVLSNEVNLIANLEFIKA